MASQIRLTMPVLAVVTALSNAKPGDPAWGFRLSEETGFGSGTIYPLLERLERAGWVTSYWEDPAPPNRPRRRLYEISSRGRSEAAAALASRESKLKHLPGFAHLGELT
jgi:PadR family transcriptional regulator, regulatory protein PadR